jgi:glycerophosphoryl diester phosphodiesterase
MPHPSGRPWVVAHQGASRVRARNTIEAFHAAATLGADAVELDVRRTADGALVVLHDAVLPGWNRPVIAMARAQLSAAAPHVPDLEQALDACAGLWIGVEVKNSPFDPDWDPEARTAGAVAELVRSTGIIDRVLAMSFDPATVARADAAGLRTAILVDRSADPIDVLESMPGVEMVLPESETMLGSRARHVVRAATAHRTEVGVWTVNEPAEMVRLAEAGVGAIFTDEPDAARRALG